MSSYNKIAEDLAKKRWEEHGYQDTHGSCYSWEIVMVRDDDVWHTFEAKQKRSD